MSRLSDVKQLLTDHDVRLIRAIYSGPEGITRGKAFRTPFLEEVLETGIGLTQAQASVTVLDQLPAASEFQPVGEVRIRPDLDTFCVLPYLQHHARMLSDLETLDGQPWELCPRSLLRGVIDDFATEGIRVQAAFENEFTLYRQDGDAWIPVDNLNCFSSAAMDLSSGFILATIDALEQQGLVVEKFFPEGGHGQQEIPVQHVEGIRAADQQVVFRETVRGVATATGHRVSFMPKPTPTSAGNGCHIHFSLWDNNSGQNLFYAANGEYSLSDSARYFIGGVLRHLPALLAFTAPTTNSYSRFRERCWSSCYRCWGPDNREATIRVASGFRGRESSTVNLEYKPADPTCNPYLALAAVLIAGRDGLNTQADPGLATLTDPALLSAAEREQQGLAAYPESLSYALASLEQNELMASAMGAARVRDYLTLKRYEIENIAALGEDGERVAYQFRF